MDCEERWACIEASTKSGKTTAMIIWLLEQALACKANQYVFWVAPIFNQSKIAYDRMKNLINDDNIIPIYESNETRMTLTLLHGAIIEFKSADNPDTLYGNDCYAAVIDEASRVSEAAWIAIRSTLTKTRGKCKLIGNVHGRKNFFYKMAAKARAGEPDYFYKRVTAWDAVQAGILEEDEIRSAQRELPDNVFRELYLAEASEDGSNPFNLQAISRAIYPKSNNPSVCFGIDLAKGARSGGDYTCIVGLDKLGSVSYFERFQHDWKITTEKILLLPPGHICIDSTGVGDAIAEPIARARPTELYNFTQKSKQILMEGLASAIQKREITILEGVMQEELESFEYEYSRSGIKYSAPSGVHDDAVCALSLAVYIHRTTAGNSQEVSVW